MSKALPKRSVLPVDGKIWNSGFVKDSDEDKVYALKIDFVGIVHVGIVSELSWL
jgi:hypothetical protein